MNGRAILNLEALVFHLLVETRGRFGEVANISVIAANNDDGPNVIVRADRLDLKTTVSMASEVRRIAEKHSFVPTRIVVRGDGGRLLIQRPLPPSGFEAAERKGRHSYRGDPQPGLRLLRLADLAFSPKANQEVFAPTIRDLGDEYNEALSQGRTWKARIVLLRGYGSFWSAVAMKLQLSLVKKLLTIWKIS